MKSLSLLLLGLSLKYIPGTFAKRCFSETLKPAYPCCSKYIKIFYTDDDGDWGIENGKWCGIGGGDESDDCFSVDLGYPCCKGDKVIYSDDSGDWGVENGKWCGIGDAPLSCFSLPLGYPCCEGCKVVTTDKHGYWGVENKSWCGIKDSCSIKEDQDKEEETDVEEPVQEVTDFDFEFLKIENNKKNMIYSPLSIEYALNMLKEGASNNTLAEIKKVIGDRTLTKYNSIDKNLSFANGLFIRDSFYDYVLPKYIKTLDEKYNAEIVKDEFKDAKNANQWIEDKTLGIIKDMLKDDIVQNPLNVMLIINALAIDMEWAYKFRTESTFGGSFYKEDGEKIKVTMMSKEEKFSENVSYYLNDDLTVLTMNLKKYNDVQLEFMAIMPKEDLSGFVEKVTKAQIEDIDEHLKSSAQERSTVDILIPKFKFNYDLKLKNDLKTIGINDAFNAGKADFSNMADMNSPYGNIYVSEALHKADIEFSEDGIKAAAVTVFVMTGGAAFQRDPPIEITINKPFMFIIRDKSTKNIWFTGTVYEPNLWENDQGTYLGY